MCVYMNIYIYIYIYIYINNEIARRALTSLPPAHKLDRPYRLDGPRSWLPRAPWLALAGSIWLPRSTTTNRLAKDYD